MTPESKNDRVQLLRDIGREVQAELVDAHVKKGGALECFHFYENRLVPLVDEYDDIIEAYRAENMPGKLVDADKIAAITGSLIMRHRVFDSLTQERDTTIAAFGNATLALRMTHIFLKYEEDFEVHVHRQLLNCFSRSVNCCDVPMTTWTVATMTQLLRYNSGNGLAWAD